MFYFGVDYYPEHWPEERWLIDAHWIACEAHAADTPPLRIFPDQAEHDRMQMHVQVAVHMIEWQPGGPELLELLSHLGAELRAEFAAREIGQATAHRIV